MKILIVSNMKSWMGVHIRQFAAGFTASGHQVELLDLNQMECSWNVFSRSREAKNARRQQRLKAKITSFAPDLLLFNIARLHFDFAAIKSYFKGIIALYDMDGPCWAPYRDGVEWIKDIDMLFTVSKVQQARLREQGISAYYLPHGVDADFYRPLELSDKERALYGAQIAFVGRPTVRRVELFSTVADAGLKLWGRRWHRPKECKVEALRRASALRRDVVGDEVSKIYCASGMMLNALREPLDKPPTIMSLQVFAVPATGTCLLTEWVEELEDAFDPDKELLVFRNREEFQEKVNKYSADKAQLKQIGEAGRRRCLAEHTHEKRAAEMVKAIS